MALYGVSRRMFKNVFANRLVLDANNDATPDYAPLYLPPTGAPGTAVEGAIYFDDTAEAIKFYDGSAWQTAASLESTAQVFSSPLLLGSTSAVTAGTGITTGVGTVYSSRVYQIGSVIKTEIFTDLTGLNSSVAGDVIGKNGGTANCHFGRITTAVNGLIFRGQMSCVEAPATGINDIDLYAAPEATLAEDSAISASTGEVAIFDAGAAWTVGRSALTTGALAPDLYLYLVGSGAGADATYTAGQFMLEFWGYVL